MTSTRGLRPLALLGAWLLATLAALPAMASRPAFDRKLDQELAEAAGCPFAVVSCPNPELGTATAAVG